MQVVSLLGWTPASVVCLLPQTSRVVIADLDFSVQFGPMRTEGFQRYCLRRLLSGHELRRNRLEWRHWDGRDAWSVQLSGTSRRWKESEMATNKSTE